MQHGRACWASLILVLTGCDRQQAVQSLDDDAGVAISADAGTPIADAAAHPADAAAHPADAAAHPADAADARPPGVGIEGLIVMTQHADSPTFHASAHFTAPPPGPRVIARDGWCVAQVLTATSGEHSVLGRIALESLYPQTSTRYLVPDPTSNTYSTLTSTVPLWPFGLGMVRATVEGQTVVEASPSPHVALTRSLPDVLDRALGADVVWAVNPTQLGENAGSLTVSIRGPVSANLESIEVSCEVGVAGLYAGTIAIAPSLAMHLPPGAAHASIYTWGRGQSTSGPRVTLLLRDTVTHPDNSTLLVRVITIR